MAPGHTTDNSIGLICSIQLPKQDRKYLGLCYLSLFCEVKVLSRQSRIKPFRNRQEMQPKEPMWMFVYTLQCTLLSHLTLQQDRKLGFSNKLCNSWLCPLFCWRQFHHISYPYFNYGALTHLLPQSWTLKSCNIHTYTKAATTAESRLCRSMAGHCHVTLVEQMPQMNISFYQWKCTETKARKN